MKKSTVARNLVLGVLLVSSLPPRDASGTIQADKVLVVKNEKLFSCCAAEDPEKPTGLPSAGNRDEECVRGQQDSEGSYVIDDATPAASIIKALHISYPNASDVRNARKLRRSPGGEVLIHGLPSGFEDLGASHADLNWTRDASPFPTRKWTRYGNLWPMGPCQNRPLRPIPSHVVKQGPGSPGPPSTCVVSLLLLLQWNISRSSRRFFRISCRFLAFFAAVAALSRRRRRAPHPLAPSSPCPSLPRSPHGGLGLGHRHVARLRAWSSLPSMVFSLASIRPIRSESGRSGS